MPGELAMDDLDEAGTRASSPSWRGSGSSRRLLAAAQSLLHQLAGAAPADPVRSASGPRRRTPAATFGPGLRSASPAHASDQRFPFRHLHPWPGPWVAGDPPEGETRGKVDGVVYLRVPQHKLEHVRPEESPCRDPLTGVFIFCSSALNLILYYHMMRHNSLLIESIGQGQQTPFSPSLY